MTEDVHNPTAPGRNANRRRPNRRNFCVLLASACVGGRAAADGGAAVRFAVISTKGTDAYTQAVAGLRAGFGDAALFDFVELGSNPQLENLAQRLAAKHPRALVTVGPEALASAAACAGNAPVISTMVLLSDSEIAAIDKLRPSSVIGEVSLDLSVTVVCREWKQLVPGKTRLGIIHNPRKNGPSIASMETQSLAAGCSPRIAACSRPEDLLASFQSFRNEVDFVWCMPDSALYTPATVKALLMASLERRVPLVGFSESFVRAGAAMGVYPDFMDVGRQTAELALKWLAGQPFRATQAPRLVRVAFNHRVARLIGLRYIPPAEGDARVAVLK